MHGTAISGGGLKGFSPKIGSLQILETTKSTLLLQAKINITNPTDYSANVPFVNINLLSNGTLLGYATAKNITVVPGLNDDILVEALWDPLTPSGKAGVDQGRELLSQYISTLPLHSRHITARYLHSLRWAKHSLLSKSRSLPQD